MNIEQLVLSRDSRASTVAMMITIAILAVLIAAPWWAGRADLRLMAELFLYLSLASLWNLMAGYAGLASVGQQAYVGLGGYMLFALTMFAGVHLIVALGLVTVLGALIAIPVATLVFRLRGAYFDRHMGCGGSVPVVVCTSVIIGRRIRYFAGYQRRKINGIWQTGT